MNFGYRRVTRTREFVYDEPWAEVVGIVADVRHGGVDLPVRPAVFRSVLQYPRQRFDVILRSPLPMDRLMPSVRDAVRQVDPSIMVSRERRLSDAVADASATVRYASAGLSVFAVFISALCAFGVYSLLAFVVAARRREIGIRVALGAAPSRLIRHFVAMTTRVLVPGLVAGLLATIAGTRVLHALLYDTSPVDPVVLAAVMGAVSLIVIAGAALPARTASRAEPAVALRD
jgi:putative ABC transport system permease protein